MLLTDARRPARTGPFGELVPLAQQDRTRWNQALIDEGVELISATLPRGAVGYYQLQAAIAAVHDEARTAENTDWPQILALYGLLDRMTDNPMVTLNRAIAAAMVHGPATGLAMLAHLDSALSGNHRLAAVRAHLMEMAGDTEGAIGLYRAAAGRTASLAEQRYLAGQAARLAEHLAA
jgi:predicted RNA polymerase sigma factor